MRVDELLTVSMTMFERENKTDVKYEHVLGTDSCNEEELYGLKTAYGVSICQDAGTYGLYGDSREAGSQVMEL